jgi:hypothetical protein
MNVKILLLIIIINISLSSFSTENSCEENLRQTLISCKNMNKYTSDYIKNYGALKSLKKRLQNSIDLLKIAREYIPKSHQEKISTLFASLSKTHQEKIRYRKNLAKLIVDMNKNFDEGFCSLIKEDIPIKSRLLDEDLLKLIETKITKNKRDKPRTQRSHRRTSRDLPHLPDIRQRDFNNESFVNEDCELDISKYSTSISPAEDQCNEDLCTICYANKIEINYSSIHNLWYAKKGYILPCGHILCKQCKRRISPKTCPWCRAKF